MGEQQIEPFREAFRGRFENVLRWEQLDALWEVLCADAGNGWYIYAVGAVSYTHLTLPTSKPKCSSRWSGDD